MKIVDAVINLCKENSWEAPQISVTYADGAEDYEQITWVDGNPNNITVDQIKAKQAELKTAYDAQAYARSRKEEYDKLNQFELMYDDKVNSTDKWGEAILAIKNKHPKG
jgi:hypothetical protein